jgi:threonine dehydrogenase-like Zn-dependent dehydrogenase
MRAAVTTGSSIEVRDDVPDPTPGSGQVLVHTIVCGICGSRQHWRGRHVTRRQWHR